MPSEADSTDNARFEDDGEAAPDRDLRVLPPDETGGGDEERPPIPMNPKRMSMRRPNPMKTATILRLRPNIATVIHLSRDE